MALNTTPRTWVAGETVTAAEMNTEIRDALTGIQGAWTAYTPTLTNITIGNGTLAAAWTRFGKTAIARCYFTAGTTTTYAAGNLGFSLPAAAIAAMLTSSHAVGAATVVPGANVISATARIISTGILNFTVDSATAATPVTNTVPAAFGTTSIISWLITYELA